MILKDMEIYLAQLEKSDLPRLRELLNYGFKRFLDEYREFSKDGMEQWLTEISQDGDLPFAIRGSKDVYKDFIVGVCSLRQIDWVAGHAELFFLMVDKDGHRATMHNRPATKKALEQILEFAFDELGLHKVWVEVYEHNNIKAVLEQFGFVAEGVRRQALFKGGRFYDSMICSVTLEEWSDHDRDHY